MSETQDYIINVKVDGLDTVVEMAASSAQQIIQAFSLVQESLQQGAKTTQDTISSMLAQLEAVAQMSDAAAASKKPDEPSGATNKGDDSSKKVENTKTAITAMTSLMDTIGKASGGAVEKIMSIGVAVLNLIPAFQAAGTAGTVMGTALSAALGVVGAIIAVVITIGNAITQAQAEAKQKMEETREEIDSLRDNNIGAGRLVAEFEMLSNKTVKTADDMQRMNDIRAELVDSYGFSVAAVDEEGRLLAGNLDLLEQQLDVSRELLFTKMQEAFTGEINTYNSALSKQIELIKEKKDLENYLEDPSTSQQFKGIDPSTYEDYEQEVEFFKEIWQRDLDNVVSEMSNHEKEAKTALNNIFSTMLLAIQNEGKEVPETLQTIVFGALNSSFEDAFSNGTNFSADAAQAMIQNMFDTFFSIKDKSSVDSAVEVINTLQAQLIEGFVAAGASDALAGSITDNILNAILGDDAANEKIISRMAELQQSIMAGTASEQEMAEYDTLANTMGQAFTNAMLTADKAIRDGVPGAAQAKQAVSDLGKTYTVTSKELLKLSLAEKAAKMSLKDAASELRSVTSACDSASDAIKDVADTKAAIKAIKDYTSATDKTSKQALDYAKAKEFLADKYGVEQDAIDGMLPSIEDEVAMKEAIALADYTVALMSAYATQTVIKDMMAQGKIVPEQGQLMVDALQVVIDKMNELGGKSVTVAGVTASADVPPIKLTSGGGGSAKNKALDREMEQLERYKALDQLTTAEEIANLERIRAKYAKKAADRQEIDEKLYALRKQLAEDELEYQKAMDQLTLREEIAAMDQMIATYKEGTSARRDLEKQRYEAQRELERQDYDLKVYYGQLTLQEQEAQLKQMIASYKEGVEDRIDLEKELYDLQQTIRQQNIDRLNGLSDAVVSALQARYEAQRETEEKTLNDSIQAWQDWGDQQVAAIQRQIDALDELTQQENDAEEEANKRRKISMIEQQLQYEQDIYNRRKLQEELSKAQEELDDWLVQKEREALRASLEKQIENVNDTVANEQENLQKKIDANNEYYEELEKEQSLQEEARRLLMQSGQEDIINLLKAYAPEYNATGQTLGDQLVDGFLQRVGDIDQWFAGLTSGLTAYQQQLAGIATIAAEQYYATHGIPPMVRPEIMTAPTITKVGPTFNVYFTEPKEYTPSEINAEIERLAQRLADLE